MPFEKLLSCLLMAALCVLLFIKAMGCRKENRRGSLAFFMMFSIVCLTTLIIKIVKLGHFSAELLTFENDSRATASCK